MKKAKNLGILLNVVTVVAIISYPKTFSDLNGLTSEKNNILEICCTWGESLNDGVLTFHSNGKFFNKDELVGGSFQQWSSKLEKVKFVKVEDPSDADILINFEYKGDQIVGQTTSVIDHKGFVKRVKMHISLNFNEEVINEDILNIVLRHEIGHALGLAHSNFYDLMNPIVNYQNKGITKCEIDAVDLANKWKLLENLHAPKLPTLPIEKTVECNQKEM